MIEYSELLKLKRWNTPTIYNGWEQITSHDTTKGHFNLNKTTDYMPEMGPMVGYAVTVKCSPSQKKYSENAIELSRKYREYIASVDGPKIVIVQDLDNPHVGSYWGEVNANIHKALGCVGTITEGAIRDVDEMTNAGFKAIAKTMCVGHAFSTPIEWGCEVEVFGCKIKPGQLIHADKHGFLAIPDDDIDGLYEASCFMDANECENLINVARGAFGKTKTEILDQLEEGFARFRANAAQKYSKKGEW